MTKLLLVICAIVGATLGMIAGDRRQVSRAVDELSDSSQLRDQVEGLRTRFADLQHDLDAARTPAAATAAREKLFQLRVDMVAVEDEIAVLARRRLPQANAEQSRELEGVSSP